MWLLSVLLSIISVPCELMLEGQIATWPVLPEELMGVKTQVVILLFFFSAYSDICWCRS